MRQPPRKHTPALTKFTFVDGCSVLGNEENPLVTGHIASDSSTKDKKASGFGSGPAMGSDDEDGEPSRKNQQRLHIDLVDLVAARRAFEEEQDDAAALNPAIQEVKLQELSLQQFVATFLPHVRDDFNELAKAKEQLSYLFMKIDINCDGMVSWDELLTYVSSQERNEHRPELEDSLYVRDVSLRECPNDECHRDPPSHHIYVSKLASYVTGGRDGPLRVWSPGMRLQRTLLTCDYQKTQPHVQAMVLLPGTLMKLVVATQDRVISLYELADLPGSRRWSVWGRVQLKDMPVSLGAWIHVSDDAHCFAIGTDAGTVPILDAKKLVTLLKDEAVRKEVVKGAIPFKFVEKALIVTLPVHTDWVCKIAYEPSLAALVSGSLDSTLQVTQLDWPPVGSGEAPTTAAEKEELANKSPTKADPNHCRTISCVSAHHKGVADLQLMNVSGRKLCATCSYERMAAVWNVETGEVVRKLVGHRALLKQLAYDPTYQLLITLAVDGEMRTWEMISYGPVQIIRGPNSSISSERISSVSFNTMQQCLVTTTCRIALWQHPRKTASEEVLNATLLAPEGHRSPLVSVLYSHSFYLLLSGDESGSIIVWDVRSGAQIFRFEHGSRLTTMQLDSTGRKLLCGGADGEVSIWNFSSGEKLRVISEGESPEAEITGVLHVPHNNVSYFVSVGWNRDVFVWLDRKMDSIHYARPRRLAGHTEDIMCVAFCPPNLLCTGSYDGSIIVHNIEYGTLTRRVPPPTRNEAELDAVDFVRSVGVETLGIVDPQRAVLPDRCLICGTSDGYLRLYSVSDMRLIDEVRACAKGEGVRHLCAEGSTTFVVTGDTAGRVKVWDVTDVAKLWRASSKSPVASARRFSTAIAQGAIKQLYTWRAHAKAISQVAYVVGVEGIVTGSTDCTVRMWTLTGEQVGVFGQDDIWSLDARSTWFDDTCHVFEGPDADDDKVQASLRKLRNLLPEKAAKEKKKKKEKVVDTSDMYRLKPSQFEELSKLGELLNQEAELKQAAQEAQLLLMPTAKEVIASLPPIRRQDSSPAQVSKFKRAATMTALNVDASSPIASSVSRKDQLWNWQSPTKPSVAERDLRRQLIKGSNSSSPNLYAAATRIPGKRGFRIQPPIA